MNCFSGLHYPKDVMLFAVYFYVRYGVSYRELGITGLLATPRAVEPAAGLEISGV